MKWEIKHFALAVCMTVASVCTSGCTETAFQKTENDSGSTVEVETEYPEISEPVQSGIVPEQILEGETGTIHYSYYLPENYEPQEKYPLMMVMPGYDMMWFGEESSGSNLNWDGFLCWTQPRRI